jgi:hypothetical protein
MDQKHIAQACFVTLWANGEVVNIENLGLAHGGGFELGAVQIEWFVASERHRDQIPHELAIEPCTKAGLGAGGNLDREALSGFKVVPGIGQLLKFKNMSNIVCDEWTDDK